MNPALVLPFAAGICGITLAVVGLFRTRRSPATWPFVAGMVLLSLQSVLTGLGLRAPSSDDSTRWHTAAFTVGSVAPLAWVLFTLVYSRSEFRAAQKRWQRPLLAAGVLMVWAALAFREQLLVPALGPNDIPEMTLGIVMRLRYGVAADVLNATCLVVLVAALMNLEQTFRSAVGTMRWRIKFVVLALLVMLGTQVYVRSQAILFPTTDPTLWGVEAAALLIGCAFLALAYARTGLADVAVYPSTAVLRSSFTLLIVGGYLFVVGVLAQFVRQFGGTNFFQLQAVVVLLGVVGLAVLLLSDRTRHRLHLFIATHFGKAQYDSVKVWSSFSQGLARVTDQTSLSTLSATLIAETFDALSVTVWLVDPDTGCLALGASTARSGQTDSGGSLATTATQAVTEGLGRLTTPFDLDDVHGPWAEELARLNPSTFVNGGHRFCVPLHTVDRVLGAIVLADRVSGTLYTEEELELLRCIGDQVTSILLNLRLADEVAGAREMEAFRTMSAFFVHDLKNAAASLNLMLKNLPVHFDDPAFRADALRGLGNTATRIDDTIARLTALRQRPDRVRVPADLNQLVTQAIADFAATPEVTLEQHLQPVPGILADPEQIHSVVTNLLTNARDALGTGGRIEVRTAARASRAVLSVADNGCGMSPAFIAESLFKPFQSTKKKGLGIGLFQSHAIVQAHGGTIQVDSEVGKGTTIVASFPAGDRR